MNTIREFATAVALLFSITTLMSACSSAPITEAQEDRATYSQHAENTLREMEKKADRLEGTQQAEMKAMIENTRTEINKMEVASDASWENYKSAINEHLYEMNNFGLAE